MIAFQAGNDSDVAYSRSTSNPCTLLPLGSSEARERTGEGLRQGVGGEECVCVYVCWGKTEVVGT